MKNFIKNFFKMKKNLPLKKEKKIYFSMTFLSSFLLTSISYLISKKTLLKSITTCKKLGIIFFLTLIQIIIHLICFLYIEITNYFSWKTISLLFAIIIASIIFIGSLWIMNDLNINMLL